jgi:hypothetical protein
MRTPLAALLLVAWAPTTLAQQPPEVDPNPVSPTTRTPLFDASGFAEHCYTWLADAGHDDPRRVFTVVDLDGTPALRISGDGFGGLTTRRRWRDYRLVVEYRWGDATYRDRTGKARDSGVLLHCQDRDGSFAADFKGPWKRSLEFQIIEGGTGDLLLVPGHDDQGNALHVSAESPTRTDRDGETVYDPAAPWTPHRSFTRVNWSGRDEDWDDVAGFRGKHDVEGPHGQWTRCEVVARGDTLEFFVNGTKVNAARSTSVSEGQILLQTEGAELFVRRFELLPLDPPADPKP